MFQISITAKRGENGSESNVIATARRASFFPRKVLVVLCGQVKLYHLKTKISDLLIFKVEALTKWWINLIICKNKSRYMFGKSETMDKKMKYIKVLEKGSTLI